MGIAYDKSLDGVRALAMLAVLAFHADVALFPGGYAGVDIFFVLSGYLITAILMREAAETGRIDYRAFLTRRARRLFPALAVLILYFTLLAHLPPALDGRRWFDAATAALYLTNIRQTFWPAETPLSHTWSLAIEQQYYLVWPFVIIALSRMPRGRALAMLALLWLALGLARTLAFQLLYGSDAGYYFTPFRASGLVLGAIVALSPWRAQWRDSRIGQAAGWVGLAGLGLILMRADQPMTGIMLAEIMTALLICAPPRFLAMAPLGWLGAMSYGIYLWHLPAFWLLRGYPVALVVAVAILMGAASYYLVERHFIGARRKAPVRRSAAPLMAMTQ